MFIKIAGIYINVDSIIDFYDVQNETNEFTHCHIVLKDAYNERSLDTSLTAEEVMQKIKEAKCS